MQIKHITKKINSLLKEKKSKTVIRNFLFLALSGFIASGALLAYKLMLARNLDKDLFGQFSVTWSLASLTLPLINLGLPEVLTRKVARRQLPIHAFLKALPYIKLFSLLFIIITILVAKSLNLENLPQKSVVFPVLAYILILSTTNLLKAVFRGRERMEFETVTNFTENLVLLLTTYLVARSSQGESFLIFTLPIAGLIGLTTALICTKHLNRTLKSAKNEFSLRSLLKESSPFLLSAMMITIYNKSNALTLSQLSNNESVANFSAAYNLIMPTILFVGLPNKCLYPLLSKRRNRTKEFKIKLKKIKGLFFLLGILFTGVFFLFSKEMISILYGKDYLSCIKSLKVLSLILPFFFINSISGTDLASQDKQHQNLLVTTVQTITILVCAILLVPSLNELGMAYSRLISEISGFVLLTVLAYKA